MAKRVKTQSQEHFARAVHANISRSTFFRNHTHKTTFNCGKLVPILIDEITPGDTYEMSMDFISRLATPIFPTMDVLELEFHAYFVPNRLVWDSWEELFGENKTGPWVPTTPPALVPHICPYSTAAGDPTERQQPGRIGDYYGIPNNLGLWSGGISQDITDMPFRGYGLIWNEWYRDQNFQAPLVIDKGNVSNRDRMYRPNGELLPVNKPRDYFSTCLPAPQKGESSLIPIELKDLVPIITTGEHVSNATGTPLRWRVNASGGGWSGTDYNLTASRPDAAFSYAETVGEVTSSISSNRQNLFPSNLWADARGMSINSTTISELRTAFQIQKLFERDARGGTRYVEMLKAHYGVDAQDYRLQRPEFLGKAHSYVGIQQVAQTSATGISGSQSPQGNLSAFSYTQGSKFLFRKSFVEHGYIHIFAIARQKKTYMEGIERMFFRRDRFDFYHPTLAHISEQPVHVREIYAPVSYAAGKEVWGYNEAWSDYRYKPNRVSGQFRIDIVPNSLKEWHYADHYGSRPYLSSEWMEDNSQINVDRTLAVPSTTNDQIIMDIAFKCKATRPMPLHSIPGLVDHF